MTFFKFFTHQSPLWQIAIVSFVVMALADVIPILHTRKILKWIAATVVIVVVLLCFAKPPGTGGGGNNGGNGGDTPVEPASSPGSTPSGESLTPFSLTITVKGSYHVTVEGLDSKEIHEEDKDEFWSEFEKALEDYKAKGICEKASLISPQFFGFEEILVETTHNILGKDIKFKEIVKGNP